MAAPASKTIHGWKVKTNLNLGDYLVPERRYIRLIGMLSPTAKIKTGWIIVLTPPCGEWREQWDDHKDYPTIKTVSGSVYVLGKPVDDEQWDKLVELWGRIHGATQFGYPQHTIDLIQSRQVS